MKNISEKIKEGRGLMHKGRYKEALAVLKPLLELPLPPIALEHVSNTVAMVEAHIAEEE